MGVFFNGRDLRICDIQGVWSLCVRYRLEHPPDDLSRTAPVTCLFYASVKNKLECKITHFFTFYHIVYIPLIHNLFLFIKDEKSLEEARTMLQELEKYFIIGEDDTQQNTINQDIAYGLGETFSCNVWPTCIQQTLDLELPTKEL